MLPEACVQRVEEYKDRLVNFKARRRNSSICLSPVMILKARGVHMFPEESSSSPSTTSTTRSVSVLLHGGWVGYHAMGSHGRQASYMYLLPLPPFGVLPKKIYGLTFGQSFWPHECFYFQRKCVTWCILRGL